MIEGVTIEIWIVKVNEVVHKGISFIFYGWNIK